MSYMYFDSEYIDMRLDEVIREELTILIKEMKDEGLANEVILTKLDTDGIDKRTVLRYLPELANRS